MKRYAVIVAGGTGTRMQSKLPKQFLLLIGLPVIVYSMKKFHAAGAELIIVLHESYLHQWNEFCLKHRISLPCTLATGGTTRTLSVKNGLNAISEPDGLVAIHDAARPLVSIQLIESLYQQAGEKGNAVPFLPVNESMRQWQDGSSKPVNRDEFITIQTPQCFNLQLIKEAYSRIANGEFTDDASLFESCGNKINLVPGERFNFKITIPEDVSIAEAVIKSGLA